MLDSSSAEVAGQDWPLTLAYVVDSNGNYSAEIENDLVIEAGDDGLASIDIVSGSSTLSLELPVEYVSSTTDQVQWTSRDELERMFGVTNIRMWSDLENSGTSTTITAQINWAVREATDEVRELLKGGAATFVVCASRPLRRVVTVIAAEILYTARGITDTSEEDGSHRLTTLVKRARDYIRRVQVGAIRLDSTITNVPKVVPNIPDDDDDNYDPFEII